MKSGNMRFKSAVQPPPNPDRDIFFGRGYINNKVIGNMIFRQIVHSHRHIKIRKNAVARVLSIISNYGGRFFERNNKTGLYCLVNKERSREKVSQLLRERKARLPAGIQYFRKLYLEATPADAAKHAQQSVLVLKGKASTVTLMGGQNKVLKAPKPEPADLPRVTISTSLRLKPAARKDYGDDDDNNEEVDPNEPRAHHVVVEVLDRPPLPNEAHAIFFEAQGDGSAITTPKSVDEFENDPRPPLKFGHSPLRSPMRTRRHRMIGKELYER